MQSRSDSRLASPVSFRLRLDSLEGGKGGVIVAPQPNVGYFAPADTKASSVFKSAYSEWRHVIRAFLVWQVSLTCLVLTLLLVVAYSGWSIGASVNEIYLQAQPTIEEVKMRGMSMVRAVDNSTLSLAHIMKDSEDLTSTQIPHMQASVNDTLNMVQSVVHKIQKPQIVMSVG